MSSDDVRSAAERIIAWCNEEDEAKRPEEPYDMPIDAETLAEHVLRETDPVPLDEAWLRSVGFAAEADDNLHTLGALEWWHACDSESEDEQLTFEGDVPVPKTRGELRRLCSALGITLQEPTPCDPSTNA